MSVRRKASVKQGEAAREKSMASTVEKTANDDLHAYFDHATSHSEHVRKDNIVSVHHKKTLQSVLNEDAALTPKQKQTRETQALSAKHEKMEENSASLYDKERHKASYAYGGDYARILKESPTWRDAINALQNLGTEEGADYANTLIKRIDGSQLLKANADESYILLKETAKMVERDFQDRKDMEVVFSKDITPHVIDTMIRRTDVKWPDNLSLIDLETLEFMRDELKPHMENIAKSKREAASITDPDIRKECEQIIAIRENNFKQLNEEIEKRSKLERVIDNQNSTTMSSKKKQPVKQEDAEQVKQEAQSVKKTASKEQGKVKAEDVKQSSGKEKQQEVKHRDPQMVTVNGEKVSHGHAYQSSKNSEDWFWTAKIDGVQLRPQHMSSEDVKAWQEKNLKVEDAMQHYYPTKLQQKVTPEEYKVANKLSDGREIGKFRVFKENREGQENAGKYKMYVEVGNRKLTQLMTHEDLNAYFDRVTTPAKLVEKTFGEQLNLASAYQKYQIPKETGVEKVQVTKTQDGKWTISASGSFGQTEKKELSKNDVYSLFHSKTATREQLAAKYFSEGFKAAPSQKREQSRGQKL